MEVARTPEDQEARKEAVYEAYRRNDGNGQLPKVKIRWRDATNFDETSTPLQEIPQEVMSIGFLIEGNDDGNTRLCQSYGEDENEIRYRELLVVPSSQVISMEIMPWGS